MTEHIAYKCPKPCTQNYCQYCDGGLFTCAICNSHEGATTTECPGRRMTSEEIELVYAGKLDFRCGEWVEEASRNSPAYWKKWREERGLK